MDSRQARMETKRAGMDSRPAGMDTRRQATTTLRGGASEVHPAAVPVWIFGYGSLLFRPGFPHEARLPAYLPGYARRFHQGSPDHRGTPERLGRVVTLVPSPGARCGGAVYRVADRDAEEVLRSLDVREQGGYDRLEVTAELVSGDRVEAVTWVAAPDNAYHLGPAPLSDLVAQIREARGPSGTNLEYVLRLHTILRELGIEDAHVGEIAAALGG
jgi:cation transport regulator ChaC